MLRLLRGGAARPRPRRSVALMPAPADAASGTLDVRPVAPKHRCGAVMDAYRQLTLGERLALTADRDPECVYDALLAEEGAAGFTFQYLERGPEVWRVVVTCRCA